MYLICVVAIFIFAGIFLPKNVKNGKQAFAVATGLVLFLYAALRSPTFSGDVLSYVKKFDMYKRYSLGEMLQLYTLNAKSPTFYLLGWIFSRIFTDAQWWLAFIGAAYAFSGVYVIYKESENPLLSVLGWLALGFFMFSLSGLRQTLALSITMLAYFPAKNRKIWKFLILVAIATLFHNSAIIFLLIYPFAQRKLGYIHLIVAGAVIVAFLGFQGQVRNLIANVFEDSYLGGYADQEEGLSMAGFIIQVAMFVFSLLYYPNVVKKHEDAKILYNLSFIGMLFQLFSAMIAEMFRVSMYFSFFNVLLIPLAVQSEPSKSTRQILTILLSVVFVIYMFRGGVPAYEFFWG